MMAGNDDDSDRAAISRTRRAVMLGGVAGVGALAWWGAPKLRRLLAGDFDFAPLSDPAGFRRIAAGRTSGGFDPLIGLTTREAPDLGGAEARVRADICAALFGAAGIDAGVVPVASFSDYNCPYCRVLTPILARMEAESQGAVRVAWHELPLLGAPSTLAAKAALAADMQGAYAAFHERLMRTRFLAGPAYLKKIGASLGIDPERLIADMDGPEVSRRIADARALSAIFDLPGTPSLVVGRTVAAGAIDEPTLRALIARERRDGPVPACAR